MSGSVRNHPDGSVEVVAEGPAEALDALHRELLQGPPGAVVEAVEQTDAEALDAGDFRILP